MGKEIEKILLEHGREKVVLFLSVYVDDIKLAGKKQNIDPMWKVLNKEVDLGEPTSFLDHVYLGCTQRQCKNKQRYCWKVMPKNVWNDIVSWQTRRLNNSTKYLLHALMTIISKKKN